MFGGAWRAALSRPTSRDWGSMPATFQVHVATRLSPATSKGGCSPAQAVEGAGYVWRSSAVRREIK